jgi:GAF domain-containing protein
MRRGPKPGKSKVESKSPVARKSPKNDGARVRDLEKHLAEAHEQLQTRDSQLIEALEQQAATSEILRVISQSQTDVQPVFEAIVRNAGRVCDGFDAVLILRSADEIEIAAHSGPIPQSGVGTRRPLSRGTVMGRAIVDARPIHVHDVAAADDFPEGQALARQRGHRSTLAVPLLCEGRPVGSLLIRRTEVRPFTDKQITMLQTFADQAVIAIANVRLFTETKEALEQQMATGEILRVISSSPTDVQPVFDAVAESAARLCQAQFCHVFRFDGTLLYVTAHHGLSPEGVTALLSAYPSAPGRGSAAGRSLLSGRIEQIPDINADTDYRHSRIAAIMNYQSIVAVPMLRDGMPIGSIVVGRSNTGFFPERLVTLLQTFADQAVIAIENVRLFTELQQKNRALTEALDQQTATSEILRVISSSPTDVQPVLNVIASSAVRLCDGYFSGVFLSDGEWVHLRATHNLPPVWQREAETAYPAPITGDTRAAKAIRERQVVHILDMQEDPDVGEASRHRARLGEYRSWVGVPMLGSTGGVGAIGVSRRERKAFSDREIALLQTFADQAVIAIENVRLFTELQQKNAALTQAHAQVSESLEQQTATSEILRVISSSSTELQPVFDAIVTSAVRLCGGLFSALARFDGEMLDLVAHHNLGPEALEAYRQWFPQRAIDDHLLGRAVLERRVMNVPDVTTAYRYVPGQQEAGFRSVLVVPMVREGASIGAIAVSRLEIGAFPENQVELLKTFADQAVIAIENVRLFTELQRKNEALTQAHAQVTESLEQQTATSEILRVIASSPADVQPVFDTVVRSAVNLCGAFDARIWRLAGDRLVRAAAAGPLIEQSAEWVPLDSDLPSPRSFLEGRSIHFDVPAILATRSQLAAGIQRLGLQSGLATPLMREGRPIGVLAVRSRASGRFTDQQVALLKTFADQAVIAIENVRLFTETKEALDQQTATAEILRVISGSPTDVQPVLDAIASRSVELCDGVYSAVFRTDGERLYFAAQKNFPPQVLEDFRVTLPAPLSAFPMTHAALVGRRVNYIPDVEVVPGINPDMLRRARLAGYRALLVVPMVRDDGPVGAIAVAKRDVASFNDKQIELLKTFADQAVIAIENVRLFTELQQKNEALTEAHARVTETLEQQTATSDILRVISRSPTDVQPVFDAIVDHAGRLCDAMYCVVYRFDGELVHVAAHRNMNAAILAELQQRYPRPLDRTTVVGRSIADRQPFQVEDAQGHDAPPTSVIFAQRLAYRTLLSVPMLRDGVPLGAIALARREPRLFTDAQIELVQTFADQGVIAVGNVRLFTELRTSNRELRVALEQQTATSEILRVISRSQTDVQPVFDAIVTSAVRLLRADTGGIFRVAGDQVELGALTSTHDAADAALRAAFPQSLHAEGPIFWAIRDRAPVNIADAETDPRVPEAMRASARARGYRSAGGVPLVRQDEAIGAITVSRREPGGFTADEIALLRTFADQAVIAIENARLLSELQARTQELTRSVEQLTALGEVGRAVSSTLDLETVLQTIVLRANELARTAGCTIWEYDEGRAEFRLRASDYSDEDDAATLEGVDRVTTIRKGLGVTTEVFERRQPVQIPDIVVEGAEENPIRRQLIEVGHHALLAVPLLSEDEVIGVLAVTRKTAGEFEPETVRLLTTFATQSALAIQNARLFFEIEDKSRQLEVASQHKSEFLANMSHELRTPMNAILGFSEVLAEGMFGEINAKQAEYLRDILESGRHLLSLINDILDLSKIEAGRMELEPTDFDLPSAIDNALTLVRERAGRRGITLRRKIDDGVGMIRADERKVKQIVLNLLSNAIKFTPEGGRIAVRAGVYEGLVEVSVTDTGVGIAPEDQGTVFEEFRQVGTADKKVEGTGLGLALSRKFVELHGGRIWVKSQVGQGSTFTFTLPVRPTDEAVSLQ